MELIFDKVFDFITTYLWDNLWFWRILGLSLFVLLVLAYSFRSFIREILRRDSVVDSDKAIFLKADTLLNEDHFREYIDTLGVNRLINWQSTRVRNFTDYFQNTGNQYLIRRLRNRTTRLVNKMHTLHIFVATHFFSYPDNQHIEDDNYDYVTYALYPEIAHEPPESEKHKIYLQRQKELHQHLDNVLELYKKYRRTIRKTLQV